MNVYEVSYHLSSVLLVNDLKITIVADCVESAVQYFRKTRQARWAISGVKLVMQDVEVAQ